MRSAGYRLFTADEVRQLCAVVQPENRRAFEAFASGLTLPGRHSAAVLCLAYALALVIDAGAGQTRDEADAAAAWTQARPFTETDLTELQRHYGEEGAAHEYEMWTPYWMAAPTVFSDRIGPKLIASARAAFDDQVNRWAAAEGSDLRPSIGAPDYSLIAFDENAGLPKFVQLLFEWGGRLRLGERFLAEGIDLTEVRFSHDEVNYIDHLYQEAFERYVDIASQADPVGEDVELAARCCGASPAGWRRDGVAPVGGRRRGHPVRRGSRIGSALRA